MTTAFEGILCRARLRVVVGLLLALMATEVGAKTPAQLEGDRPDIYNRLAITPGNIQALRERNKQLETRIRSGLTPEELQLFYTYPVHPVQASGKFALTPGVSVDAIPVSPGVEAPPVAAPKDILTHVDAGLRSYFRGYANLGMMAGDGTIGLATLQGTEVGYQLDSRFLKESDVVLSPTTPVLTVSISGLNEAEKLQAESYLSRIRQYLLTSLPTAMPLAAILMALGAMVVGALKARGFQAQYQVAETDMPTITNASTVEIHEQQHVWDYLRIQQGQLAIRKEYLDSKSPYHEVTESLMEVRAGLAEAGKQANWPYLAINAANLRKALLSTPGMPADLYALALKDLQYAQYLLQEYNGDLINF